MIRKTFALVVGCVLAALLSTACAQGDWPAKPVVLIVPFPPGGGTDAFARPLVAQLYKQIGKTVIIDNHGGAGGNLGATIAARSVPDGYTFFMGAVHHAIAPSVYSKLEYDLERDFAPVTSIAHMPQVIVINPSKVKATELRELISLVQQQPGKFTFGSGGNGTSHHVAGELFKIITRTQILHVPYKGNGPAMTALMGGQIDMMFDGLGSSAGAINGGKVKALAVAGKKRAPGFPDVPTAAEAGLPGYVVGTWYAMWGRKGTPEPIIERMYQEVARALETKQLKDIWFTQGATAGGEAPAEFAKFVRSEVDRWAKVAKESGARAD